MPAPLYATEAIARDRWVRADATGEEIAALAAEHQQLAPQQRAHLAEEIAGCSDGDLAAFLELRREQQPVLTVGKLRPTAESKAPTTGSKA